MIKAFLSHAWTDKEFVRAVADELGRQFCHFDEYSFDTAENFKVSIETHLKESSVFVFFASEIALTRPWVEFELEETWYNRLQGKVNKSIVFILDSSIEPTDLPPWLNRAKIVRVTSPKIAAREIRQYIDTLIRSTQHPYFEGRSSDIEKFESLLTPIGSPPPKNIAIYGLPKIGKKTFLSKVANLTLSFNRVLPIVVSQGDDLRDLAIKVADQLEPYSTKAGFDHIIDTIKSQEVNLLVERIIDNFEVAISNKELPALIDDGGLLNSDGFLHSFIEDILSASAKRNNLYLFIISNRKPTHQLPSLALRPLSKDHIKRLIAKISGDAGLSITPDDIRELGEYVNGYPPSAYYAIELVKAYGIDVVLADKQRLVHFRTSVFIKYLTDKILSDNQTDILAVLANYSPLPLTVLTTALDCESSDVASGIASLIDQSLVVPAESGMYEIAEPLTDAITSALRPQKTVNHSAIRDCLKELITTEDTELPRLDLCRQYFRASIRSGKGETTAFHMVSDIIRLAEDYYHRRDYKTSIRCATLALQERPKNEKARNMLIKALIHEEQWQAANEEISKHKEYAPIREIFFLEGFSFRKQGELKKAITAFENSVKSGRTGVTINRELANCYYLSDNLEQAKHYINEALKLTENPFIIDLSVQISTREGDEKSARDGLEKLRAIDTESFYKHRLSTVELKFGTVSTALKAARAAMESLESERPPFNVLSQLATCLIRNSEHTEAEQVIMRLAKHYKHKKIDVRLGLECRLEIERKRYRKALEILQKIKDSDRMIYKAMKRDALAGELKTSALSDETRITYQKSLNLLERELATKDINSFWIAMIQ